MKIKSMIIKKTRLLIIVFVLLISNKIIASDININYMTLKEAIEYSQNGNPAEAVIDYCRENNLYGAETFYEKFGDGEWANVELGDETEIEKTIQSGIDALLEKHKNEQKEESFIELKKNLKLYIIVSLLIVFFIISVVKMKKVLMILFGIGLVFGASLIILNFKKVIEKNGLYDNVLKSLNNIDDRKAAENLNLDKEINISHRINDYIIKVWYSAKCKAENIDLFNNEMVNGNNVFEEPIIFYDDYIDVEKNYVDKWDYYGKIIVNDWTGRDYPIQQAGISKNSLQRIYDNITNEDIENYKNKTLVNKLVGELEKKLKHREPTDKIFENETLSGYIATIAQGSACYFSKYIDDEVKKNYKYWYIDGENKTVELPYGIYLKYEKQEAEKIDGAKWVYTSINEIDYTDENGILYAYYIKDDRIYGDYTITTSQNEKILYNLYELTHRIKKSKISLTIDSNYEFNIVNPLKESDMWRLDTERINMVEFNENNRNIIKTCGTQRDLSLMHCLLGNSELYERYICSDNFNKKYLSLQKIISEKNSKDYDNVFILIDFNKPDKLLRKLIIEDDTEIYLIFKVHWIDGVVDDIEMYEIPQEFNNLSPEEMYQLAFND